MKLHEFTDRLYAMGGIEQEEKRSRRLNEWVEGEQNFFNCELDKELLKHVRAKRAARKNESLNLNESKQGLIDYFYKLTSTFDMDPDEQVDYLLGYMSESELLDAIDDFKEYMNIDDEDIM